MPFKRRKTAYMMEGRVPNIRVIKTKKPAATTVNFLKRAIDYYDQEELTKAFECFVNYFENLDDCSQAPHYAQNTFTRTICEMGAVFEETDNFEDMIKCYLQAINLFPKNHVILNNLGGYMFKSGETDIARRYLEAAVKARPDYLPAERNLMHVKWSQVPRWHFRMLNDVIRNDAYQKAIHKCIDEGYTNVVDIGAGCGLLSLIASEKGHTNVTAIEENKTLYKMFQEILADLEIKNVRLLNCNSNELTSAPAPCNLIVTEIFDVALFGEHALESLIHGLKTLVTYPKFKVVPASADLFVTGVNYRPDCFYAPTLNNRCVNEIPALNMCNICIKRINPDPYDGEYMNGETLEEVTCTDTVKLCHIDFSNWENLDQIINDNDFSYNIEIRAQKSEWICSLVVWFELNLTDDITITTNPAAPDCLGAWEQAVFQLDHPIYVETGETLRIKATVLDSELKFRVIDRDKQCYCYHVSGEVMRFLNDKGLVDSIIRLADTYNDPTLKIVDLNTFPLFGFLMAKKGCQVYYLCKVANEIDLYEEIIKRNNIKEKNMIFIEKNSLECLLELEAINIVFIDPINCEGALNKTVIPTNNGSQLTILPQSVNLKFQLANSYYLQYCNRVYDPNALSFGIGAYINEYTGTEHPDIDHPNKLPMSEVMTVKLDGDVDQLVPVPVTHDGVLNGIYFWFEICYSPDISYDAENSIRYKKACVIIKSHQGQSKGDTVDVRVRRHDEFLKICVSKKPKPISPPSTTTQSDV